MAKIVKTYAESGISISKASINVGDKVIISYEGLLAKSGADTIFLHFGYGNSWENKDFIQMENKEGIFSASIKVTTEGNLNITFKDSADNWDNNSGEDYSFKVSKKETSAVGETAPAKVIKEIKKSSVSVKPAAKVAAPKKTASKAKTPVEKEKK